MSSCKGNKHIYIQMFMHILFSKTMLRISFTSLIRSIYQITKFVFSGYGKRTILKGEQPLGLPVSLEIIGGPTDPESLEELQHYPTAFVLSSEEMSIHPGSSAIHFICRTTSRRLLKWYF